MKCHRDHREGDNEVSSGLLSLVLGLVPCIGTFTVIGELTIIKSGETTSPGIHCHLHGDVALLPGYDFYANGSTGIILPGG